MLNLLKQSAFASVLLILVSTSFATTWTAGSSHKGKVTVPIEMDLLLVGNVMEKVAS